MLRDAMGAFPLTDPVTHPPVSTLCKHAIRGWERRGGGRRVAGSPQQEKEGGSQTIIGSSLLSPFSVSQGLYYVRSAKGRFRGRVGFHHFDIK